MRAPVDLRSLLKSALIFLLIMGFLLPVIAIRARDSGELQRARLSLLAVQVSRGLERQIVSRVGVLNYFAEVMPVLGIKEYEDFARWVRPIRTGMPGFFAINFVNADGVIQWVEPLDGNEPALGKRPMDRPGIKTYFDQAVAAREPRLTHFVQLYQGPVGFAVEIPTFAPGAANGAAQVRGYVNGVFALDEIMNSVIPETATPFAIEIRSLGSSDAVSYTNDEAPVGDAVGISRTTVYGQPIEVRTHTAAATGVARHVDLATSLLVTGALLLSLLISSVSYMLFRSQARLRDRLERERFQGALLNLLVHDILNPLLVIRYSADAMSKLADGAVRQQLSKVYYGLEQVHDVISRVRDIRAVELGKMRLTARPVPINDVIRSTFSAFEQRMKEKGIVADFEMTSENPGILVDRVIFQNNVVNNVLSNAVKFTEGGRRIRMHAKQRHGQVILEIEDGGVGMSQTMVDTVLDERADLSLPGTRGESGSGIGMLQIKSYTRFFGGRVVIHSRPRAQFPDGHGTTVCLYLPMARDADDEGGVPPP